MAQPQRPQMMRVLLAVMSIMAVVFLAIGMAVAETPSDCIGTRIDQRRMARAAFDREAAACQGNRQCLKDAQAKWDRAAKQIDSDASGCRARFQSQTRQPTVHWKPGDPAPIAPDGRR
jgi:hypothetical protein